MNHYYSEYPGLLRTELSLGVTAASVVAKPLFRRANRLGSSSISMEISGSDSDGREFKNAEEMWREQVGDPNKKTDWYRQGVGYWEVSIIIIFLLSQIF